MKTAQTNSEFLADLYRKGGVAGLATVIVGSDDETVEGAIGKDGIEYIASAIDVKPNMTAIRKKLKQLTKDK